MNRGEYAEMQHLVQFGKHFLAQIRIFSAITRICPSLHSNCAGGARAQQVRKQVKKGEVIKTFQVATLLARDRWNQAMALDPSSDLTDVINPAHFGVDRSRCQGQGSVKVKLFVQEINKGLTILHIYRSNIVLHVMHYTWFCLSF